jgi:two-component system NtrC family response regulator
LQEQVFQRVGGREDIRVNARIVAATNSDIEAAIAQGDFREDLYYRLGVVVTQLPPLKERGDDVLLLANLFLRRYASEYKKRVRCFSVEAIKQLQSYDWPGNVRELENKIKRAVVMCDTQTVEAHDLGFKAADVAGCETLKDGHLLCNVNQLDLKGAKAAVEKALLTKALDQCSGNIMQAAKILGVSRPTLYDLMKKHGLYVDENKL